MKLSRYTAPLVIATLCLPALAWADPGGTQPAKAAETSSQKSDSADLQEKIMESIHKRNKKRKRAQSDKSTKKGTKTSRSSQDK